MSKTILVIDRPMSCGKCKLHNKDYGCCQATRQSVYPEFVSKDCPLKPMPEKTHKNGGCRVIDGKEWWYDSEHDDGWNECIDEILGEKE